MNMLIVEPHGLRLAEVPKDPYAVGRIIGGAIDARISEEERICVTFHKDQTYEKEFNQPATTVMRRLGMLDMSQEIRGVVLFGGFVKGVGAVDAPAWLAELVHDAAHGLDARRCA